MNKIKFSHRYYKMPEDVSETTILQVIEIDRKELSDDFVSYDTGYKNENGDYEEYPLPKGKLILLILESLQEGMQSIIWTTIRTAWPPHKVQYYKDLVGQEVEIVLPIEEDK